ncbi:MAG: type IX secretion system plug protein domain-containing protein [Bacteroidota bacterium]
MIKTSVFLLSLLLSFSSFCQLVYDNQEYDKNVRTVYLVKKGTDDRYPIVSLNSTQQLELSFDMLGNKNEYFQYTIVHCNAQWQPTGLNQNEYIRGLTFDNVNDFKFSTNTYVKYVHYSIALPNENIKPMIAGNYLIKIYRNFDEEDLVLTRRMMVLNSTTTITGTVKPASLAQFRYTKQEIGFSVNYKGFTMPDPFQDVNVVIMQNFRWDNAIRGLKPLFIRDNTLDYNYFDQNLFPGGNEFRFFDIRSLRQFSPNVKTKTLDSVYHAYLQFEESRGSKQYFQYIDFNGKRVIDNKDGQNPAIDGDYANITFYLLNLSQLDQDVYVFGEFTDWRLLPEYKMWYNKNRLRYELDTQLKQGRYEYKYATPDATGAPDESTFEGSHSNTENEYLILIYHKHIQFKYDELVGAQIIKTQF